MAGPQQQPSGGPPASFDEWLDQRLKVLYEAVLNEPLPTEIVSLLQKPRNTK